MKSKIYLLPRSESNILTKYILHSDHMKKKCYSLIGAVFISFSPLPSYAEIVTVPATGRTGTNGAAGTFNTSQGTTGGAGGAAVSLTGTATGLFNEATVTGGRGGVGGGATANGGDGGTGGRAVSNTIAGVDIQNNGTLTGGSGGNGGAASFFTGGDGGIGGTGLFSNGAASSIENNGTITGGTGGNGGTSNAVRGPGGAGGVGVAITNGAVLTNTSTINGGRGGAVGSGGGATAAGAGGAGVTANGNTTIINSGTISGGLNGTGTARANAVTLTGGTNVLRLLSGSVINGNVVATAAGGDTLELSGDTDGSFSAASIGSTAQYRNFTRYNKTGNGTWTLTGTTGATTSWVIGRGVLSIADDKSLGADNGTLTLNTGTLQSTASTISERDVIIMSDGGTFDTAGGTVLQLNGQVSGAGRLEHTGAGTLLLNEDNIYTGGTLNDSGTLQLGDGGTKGSVIGDITNQGILAINRSDTFTLDNIVSGTGQLHQNGTGTTVIADNNVTVSSTTINNGTLQIGDGGTTGELAGDITNNSILAINRSDTFTLSNVITGSGQIHQNGTGTTIITGENSYSGDTVISSGTLQIGDGNLNGKVSGNIKNESVLVVDNGSTLTLNGKISGSGQLQKNGSDELILTGDYALSGGTFVNDGELTFSGNNVTTNVTGQTGTTLNLRNGATLNGWIDPLDVNIDQGSVWNMSGSTGQNVLDTLTLAGSIISVSPSGSFVPRDLTVTNLVGQQGTITLNTVVGDDSSASDRIIIDGGSATGTTNLIIRNVGGTGGGTSGNGIEVVQAINGGTTSSSAFRLGQPLYASAYEYTLLRGALDGSAPDNWYLSTNNANGLPNYRPGVSVSSSAALSAAATNMALMSHFYERSGFYGINVTPSPVASNPCVQNMALWCDSETRAWGRYIYENITHKGDGKGVNGDSGAAFKQNISGIQLGNDLWRSIDENGNRQYAGVYATIGLGKGDVAHTDGSSAGTNRTDVYNLGAYFSHVRMNDAWVDAVVQGGLIDTRSSARDGGDFETEGYNVAASLEAGWPVLNHNGWKVEPHVRAFYQIQSLNDTNDSYTDIHFGDYQSLQSSGGLRVSHSGLIGNTKYSAWVDTGVGYEFKGESRTRLGSGADSVNLTTKMQGSYADLSVGGSVELSKTLSMYTSANWTPRFDNTEYSLGASVGVRGTW